MTRVPLYRPFTPTEDVIVQLIGRGLKLTDIAAKLNMKTNAVHFHVGRAAAKIPGTLPRKARILTWVRGGNRELLGADLAE